MKHLDEGTLQAWLDMPRSGLDASEVIDIERHLGDCEACAAVLETLRGSDEDARSLLAAGLDRSVPRPPFEEVVARAHAHRTSQRGVERLNRMAWAASVVVALGVGWMSNEIYRGGGPGTPVQPVPVAEEEVSAESPERQDVAVDAPTEATRTMAPPAEPAAPPSAVVADAVPTPERERAAEPAPENTDLVADAGAGAAAAAPAAQVEARGPDAVADADARADDRARQGAAAFGVAEDATVVRGVVRDSQSGEPVASVQVFLEELDLGVLTEPDGSYTLVVPEASADSLDVVAARIGYRTETQPIFARGDVVADFTLQQEALQLQEVVVTGTVGGTQRRALGNAVERAESLGLDWRPESREAVETALGRPLLTVPGLAELTVESTSPADAGPVARIRQELGDSGSVLTLVQGRADAERRSWPVFSEGAIESRRIGELLITATAPVPADSLSALLDALR